MRRKYIEATKELDGDLKRIKEALVVSGGAPGTEGLEDVQELFRYKQETVVHRWITDRPVCLHRHGECVQRRSEDEDMSPGC